MQVRIRIDLPNPPEDTVPLRARQEEERREAGQAEIARLRNLRDQLLQQLSATRAFRGYMRNADRQAAFANVPSWSQSSVSGNPLAGAPLPQNDEDDTNIETVIREFPSESPLPHAHGISSDVAPTEQRTTRRVVTSEHRAALNTAAPIIRYTREQAEAILGRLVTEHSAPGLIVRGAFPLPSDRAAVVRWHEFNGRIDEIQDQIHTIRGRSPTTIEPFLPLMRRGMELIEECLRMFANDETVCMCRNAA